MGFEHKDIEKKGGTSLFPKEVMTRKEWKHGLNEDTAQKGGRLVRGVEHRYAIFTGSLVALLCGVGPSFNLSVLPLGEKNIRTSDSG